MITPHLTLTSLSILYLLGWMALPLFAQSSIHFPSQPPKATYNIDAKIDENGNKIEGMAGIELRNTSSRPLSRIAFDWARSSFRSIEVKVEETTLAPLNTPDDQGTMLSPLVYVLPEPAAPGTVLTLSVRFEKRGIVPASGSRIQSAEWYPRLWWDGVPVHDDFRVKLEAPPDYVVATSGRYDEQEKAYMGKGLKTFGIFMEKDLSVMEEEAGGIHLRVLYPEGGDKVAETAFETARDALAFYNGYFGFFPFDFLNIIPGGSGPWGGYPFASGMVVIHGMTKFEERPLLHWQWITAHELGHEYWGEYVMEADNPGWLWIGLGIYTDREFVRAAGLGLERHEKMMQRFTNGLKEGYDITLDITEEHLQQVDYDYNNVAIHGKGFSVISALASTIGEEKFKDILDRLLREYGGKRLGYRAFQAVCETETGQSLEWFFDQWVRSGKYLDYHITSTEQRREGQRHITTVTIEKKGALAMPVPVMALFEDDSRQVKSTDRLLAINHLLFESSAPLKEVVLDPGGALAMPEESLPLNPEQLIRQIRTLPYYQCEEDSRSYYAKATDLELEDLGSWNRLGMILFDQGHYQNAFHAFENVLTLDPPETYKFRALVWMGHLKDLLRQREEALRYYREALQAAQDHTITHSQYGMKLDKEWVEERLKTPFEW